MKFTYDQLEYIKENFKNKTSINLFNHLVKEFDFKFCYTSFRSELYVNGFHKVIMRRWSKSETDFLLNNYKSIGNIEIGKLLTKGKRVFTKKQVQKKMQLLNLKRTDQELQLILERNKSNGLFKDCGIKAWETRLKNNNYQKQSNDRI
ncbi:hypothetical protein FNJ88_11005 [Chryseobacterium sp. SNU WT5]|uniref:sialidase domain-containing protein n=1 Tax=Chryseobacterium sp. SNU WT5 TaxID=2594269 RepID=UPI00117FB755|nr:sialidase domain-containing protein [Chryseobacterium sp. SNU WT5]QDP86047.1 hypothetical protein FNJ88_11005 [Chryseobacterium sp. SNU WT5]